jgi:hypothetical protein
VYQLSLLLLFPALLVATKNLGRCLLLPVLIQLQLLLTQARKGLISFHQQAALVFTQCFTPTHSVGL